MSSGQGVPDPISSAGSCVQRGREVSRARLGAGWNPREGPREPRELIGSGARMVSTVRMAREGTPRTEVRILPPPPVTMKGTP